MEWSPARPKDGSPSYSKLWDFPSLSIALPHQHLESIKESVTTVSGETAQSAECWPLKQEDLSQVADEQQ